jgi:hypothetical protein
VLRSPAPKQALLVDLYAGEDDVRKALADGAAEWARGEGAEGLHVEVLAGGATARMVERLGFHRREPGPGPVPFAVGEGALPRAVREGPWWIMGGDRDI